MQQAWRLRFKQTKRTPKLKVKTHDQLLSTITVHETKNILNQIMTSKNNEGEDDDGDGYDND